MNRFFILFFLSVAICIQAQEPTNYYITAVGKTGASLKSQLCAIVGPHTERTYAQLWTDFQTTDKRSDGKVWDMYSNCSFTFVTNQDAGSGGTAECQYYNREHSFPKSWFSDATPMYTDLFHLYPTDKYVNNARGNYPFGETSSPTNTYGNGSKIGASSVSGYNGIVFEPANEYKGDFARTYFYMVTAYDNKVASWISDQLAGNQYPALSAWSVSVLLKWNNQDPVSKKETDRNNAVYSIQNNRNPFIDHPELAEYIWGSHMGDLWSISTGVTTMTLKTKIIYHSASEEIVVDGQSSGLKYTILNPNGQIMKNGEVPVNQSIGVSSLSNGLYLLTLSSSENSSVQKFIINRK